ncbi:MAG TPA: glycoside hydrolase family 9 protein, partial [Polyangiaceae bacterium]|nr:glycoside hydrolase family 9 protein [Polyangiaceae bacterium]
MNRILPLWIGSLAFALSLGCDPGTSIPESEQDKVIGTAAKQCQKSDVRVGDECVAIPQIRLNTVGYLVGQVKRATVLAVEGVDAFQVIDTATQQSAFDGVLSPATTNEDTADTTRIADFSPLKTPGTYILKVDGLVDSPPFSISENVYDEPLRVTMLGLYGLRCGVAVELEHQGQVFKHAPCHLHDGQRAGQERDGTGGWHDAGDYGKYTINAAFALAFTLKAWEDFGQGLATVQHIPNYDGALPAWLAESKFQLDQILKMQFSDGSVSHMLGPYNATGPASFPASIMPENDTYTRAFSDASTPATASFAAVAAIGARVFRSYDAAYADRCLAAAQQAQAYLDQNSAYQMPALRQNFTHDAYASRSDTDDKFWALAELWRTTGDSALLARVEATDMTDVATNFDWEGVKNMGVYSYLQATSDARSPALVEQAKAAVLKAADRLVTTTEKHAYGHGIGATYYWG